MLSLNVRALMSNKGIHKPLNRLRKYGFGHTRAWQLLNGKAREVKVDQVETLCFFLKCTPNDLFLYTPGKPPGNLTDEVPPPDHPLHTLSVNAGALLLAYHISNMTQREMIELAQLLDERKREKKEQQP